MPFSDPLQVWMTLAWLVALTLTTFFASRGMRYSDLPDGYRVMGNLVGTLALASYVATALYLVPMATNGILPEPLRAVFFLASVLALALLIPATANFPGLFWTGSGLTRIESEPTLRLKTQPAAERPVLDMD